MKNKNYLYLFFYLYANYEEINDYIINLDDSNGGGTHWTVSHYHPLNSCYFDSFGFVPPLEVEQKIKPFIYKNTHSQCIHI
jgi:hypothetical protein